jgi:hypothetical protein
LSYRTVKGRGVAHETDFLDLYKILGLDPGCELAEFKQAYRRRVVVLHPDRRANDQNDIIAAERLQRLTALYGAAMQFQRQHGRLPGAARTSPSPNPVTATAAYNPVSAPVTESPRRRPWWLVLPLTFLIAWGLWNRESAAPAPADLPVQTAAPAGLVDDSASTTQVLQIGMSSDAVRAIEGTPLVLNEDRWEYGPSWIQFRDHRVAGWYSSVLRPLKGTDRETAETPH